MSNKQLILVTGINGYLGAHLVEQLVKAGYRVRGTVRSGRVALAKEGTAIYGGDVEVVAADDLAFGDFTEALKGVSGVIHAAAPLVGRDSPESALTATIEGALNILRQTEKAGIRRFVLVSSIITVKTADDKSPDPWTDNDWVSVTREQALASKDPGFVYVAEKTLAEKAVWEFAEAHPHVDVTTLNPPIFLGPFAPSFRFRYSEPIAPQLSTNAVLSQLLSPQGTFFTPLLFTIDVRDVALSAVKALTAAAAAATAGTRKRLLFIPNIASWKQAAELVAEARPELKDRISGPARTDYIHPPPPTPVDNSKAAKILGLSGFIDWKESVLTGIDAVLEAEKAFAEAAKQ
ncbi:NAD-P-binding protein [Trametes meyenii]|nr:NAD-P-binding protein [Trametes meyenii]